MQEWPGGRSGRRRRARAARWMRLWRSGAGGDATAPGQAGRAWDGPFPRSRAGRRPGTGREDRAGCLQIISKVILEATEEVLATMGRIAGRVCQASAAQPQGPEEEAVPPASQKNPWAWRPAEAHPG